MTPCVPIYLFFLADWGRFWTDELCEYTGGYLIDAVEWLEDLFCPAMHVQPSHAHMAHVPPFKLNTTLE